MKCFVENCLNEPKFYCTFRTGYVFSCIAHISQHTDEGDASKHNIKVGYQNYNCEKKQCFIDAYGKAIESTTNT